MPVRIRSWEGELTSQLANYLSVHPKVGLSDGMLRAQPLLVLKGLPQKALLSSIITGLPTDGQDTGCIQYGFLARGEGFPTYITCWLATGGSALYLNSGILAYT